MGALIGVDVKLLLRSADGREPSASLLGVAGGSEPSGMGDMFVEGLGMVLVAFSNGVEGCDGWCSYLTSSKEWLTTIQIICCCC